MQINNSFQKNANISMVAHLLWKKPGISRVEIARELGLYRSTVSNIVNTLISNSIVKEGEEGESLPQGGRKPIFLKLNSSFGTILGIEIQPFAFSAVLINAKGTVLFEKKGSLLDIPLLEAITNCIDELLADTKDIKIPLLGICLGIPGIIDSFEGTILKSDPFQVENIHITSPLSKRYEVPVLIENDAKSLAWLELAKNKKESINTFMCLNAEYLDKRLTTKNQPGMGVGIGIALDGTVYLGSKFAAGEYKSCSWKGGKDIQTGLPKAVLEDLDTNPESFSKWVQDLFVSIIPLVSVFDFQAVYVHGDIARKKNQVQQIIKEKIPQFEWLLENTSCKLFYEDGNDFAVALGVAQMYFIKLFTVVIGRKGEGNLIVDWDDIFEMIKKYKEDL